MVVSEADGLLVNQDLSNSEGGTFRLLAVYAPTGAERLDFFRRLIFHWNISLSSASNRLKRNLGCAPE